MSAPGFDFGAALAAEMPDTRSLPDRIAEADELRRSPAAGWQERTVAEADARALRLRLLRERSASCAPARLAVGLDAWARVERMTCDELDRLIAALDAADNDDTKEAGDAR